MREIQDGAAGPPYPFYGALLYTDIPGADLRVGAFVNQHGDELDALTGDNCLLFFIHDPLAVHEVYKLADALGVSRNALPCAAFFTDPSVAQQVLRVRLNDFGLPITGVKPAKTGKANLARNMRALTDALARCASEADETRLDALRGELQSAHSDLTGDLPPSALERVESTARAANAIKTVVAAGKTVVTAILGIAQ